VSQTAIAKTANQTKPNRLWMPLLGVAVLGAGWGGFELYHSQRILPGIVVAGVPVGGMTQDEAVQALRDAKLPIPVVAVRAGDQTMRVQAAEFGWRMDYGGMVDSAYAIGRDAGLFENIGKRFMGNKSVALSAKVDPKTFRSRLSSLAQPFAVVPKDAALVLTENRYIIRPDVDGQGVDFENAIKAFRNNPMLTDLELNIQDVPATIQAQSLEELATQANSVLRPLTLTYPTPSQGRTNSRTLSSADMANLFFVEKTGLRLDEKAIADVLRAVSSRFDQAPQDARYVRQDGNLVRRPSVDGYALDLAAAKKSLAAAVLDPNLAQLPLPVVVTQPKVSTESIPDPKTLAVLSSSTTRYGGSSRERVLNAAIAANKLDGYVVPQGEVFSFNGAVGEISESTGFVEGLIISGGRTQKGVGGGVCQASTTAFAALYKAGLPVVERNQHSYKVRWYDDVMGLDAAVYYPSLDLRMTNNTPGPIVIRASTSGSTMTVSLLGVSDGRKVAVSKARILRRTPHPPAKTVFNSRLPAGVSKQVDYAVDGYNVNVVRTINGQSESLYTAYRPWQAVFEVGPSRVRPATVRPSTQRPNTLRPAAARPQTATKPRAVQPATTKPSTP
jgi:vancomycin resistance protein YoaR